jgi:hypothetical protein
MLRPIQTSCALAVGTFLYSLLISGAGPFRLDWPRAMFLGAVGFLAHCLYLYFKSKSFRRQPS